MSSTSIVIKCITDARQNNSPHGQITIGTLILQVLSMVLLLMHRTVGLLSCACSDVHATSLQQ